MELVHVFFQTEPISVIHLVDLYERSSKRSSIKYKSMIDFIAKRILVKKGINSIIKRERLIIIIFLTILCNANKTFSIAMLSNDDKLKVQDMSLE